MTTARTISLQLRDHVTKTATRAILAVSDELVAATPVLTGFAANNWMIGVGSPATFTVPDLNTEMRRRRVARAKAARLARRALLATLRGLPKNVYITNNVPYIGRLNAGSSAKAPSGFVQRAIDRGLRRAR